VSFRAPPFAAGLNPKSLIGNTLRRNFRHWQTVFSQVKTQATTEGWRRLWRPSADKLFGVAAVLAEHWRAAAKMRPARLFWGNPVSWLKARSPREHRSDTAHHLTSGGRLIR
jgi:hypothetical protein